MYVVATISKNSYTAKKIEEILAAGATVLRYNFSHGTPAEMQEKVQIARQVISKMGLNSKVKILADLPGAKIRVGHFTPTEHPLAQGEEVTFRSAESSDDPKKFIPVDHPSIGDLVKVGQEISCRDGELGLKVTRVINHESFKAKAINATHVASLKALNIGSGMDTLDHFTDKMIAHLSELHKIQPEMVAFSFVKNANYLRKAKKMLKENNPSLRTKIVSKIETEGGVKNIRSIAQECDYILVARGDLGLTVPIERLGLYQKKIVQQAKEEGAQVIVSTQILDSTLTHYIPSRAEILDLTNIVLDGADGIMLAKETGIGLAPGQAVTTALKVIQYVQRHKALLSHG